MTPDHEFLATLRGASVRLAREMGWKFLRHGYGRSVKTGDPVFLAEFRTTSRARIQFSITGPESDDMNEDVLLTKMLTQLDSSTADA